MRFIIFGYDTYYPGGGQGDQCATFASEVDVRKYFDSHRRDHDHWDVLDMVDRRWRHDLTPD